MLKKFIAVKNVGRFKNSAAPGNPQLAKNTLISGANGYGKTTLCAILRSLQSGDAAHVIGRQTLGATDSTSIELLLEAGAVARFDGAAWSMTLPNLAIFDGTFVEENVHSGEVVEINQKRNLYRVIIGQDGVQLAKEDARLASDSRAKTSEITASAKVIETHCPAWMPMSQYLALPVDPDINAKLVEQERAIGAIRQAEQVAARGALSEIAQPTPPDDFTNILARTIDDVAADTEQKLADHIAAHSMGAAGKEWLAEGAAHADSGTCPFCGQDIHGLPLVAAYRAVFSEAYRDLKRSVAAQREQIEQSFDAAANAKLETLAAKNTSAAEFWAQYCTFNAAGITMPAALADTIQALGRTALSLLDAKARAPLEPAPLDAAFTAARQAYGDALAAVDVTNTDIRLVNKLIAEKKTATAAADLFVAQKELARLQAIKKRREEPLVQQCADYERLNLEKNAIDIAKTSVRKKLEAHTKAVVKPYENRINAYLDSFNAGFAVVETKHGYPGGVATSSYQLVINNTPIDVGDRSTPNSKPSFKNTLSSGDRSTLALAFFLTQLERDKNRAQKVVVFDDPFQSQDAFRRRQTVHEIKKTGTDCAQVIVLSHDATFLKQVWDKAPQADRVAIQIVDHRALGSKLLSADLEKACQGRVASEIDDLLTYLATGAGKALDLIKKSRVVLETHYRTTYSAYFHADDGLGDMAKKIRDGDDTHPAKPILDELAQINDYTAEYHHGDNLADGTPDQIDHDELTGFVRRTLRIVNALQA